MRKLGSLTLVAVALLYLSQAVSLIFSLGNLAQGGAGSAAAIRSGLSFGIAAIGVALGLSVCLILFREPLSRLLFPGDEDVAVTLDARSLLFVGIVLIGLNVAMAGLVGAAFTLASALGQRAASRGAGDPVPGFAVVISWYQLAADVVRFALGLGLVWVARPISARLTQARASAPEPEASSTRRCPECGAPYDPRDYRPGADARCAECHAILPGDDA